LIVAQELTRGEVDGACGPQAVKAMASDAGRISTSKYRESFVLKGAMLMRHWLDDPHRPTRDLDLHGFGDSDPELTLKIFREICGIKADDAVVFDIDGLVVDQVREESGYSGLRLKTYATVDGARVRLWRPRELAEVQSARDAVKDRRITCAISIRSRPTRKPSARSFAS
jgi:hypothetical protein